MTASRPCPQCRQTARLRDGTLVWVCGQGHRFMAASPVFIADGCTELVTVEGKKRRVRCGQELVAAGAFRVCPRHPTTSLWANDGSAPFELDAAGLAVWDRIVAKFNDDPVLWPGPDDGETPWGVSEAEWERLRPAWVAAHDGRASSRQPVKEEPAEGDPPPPPVPAPIVTPAADTRPVAATITAEQRMFDVPVAAPKVRKKIPALSPSSASVLGQCPRRFELTKVLGMQEPTGKPAVVGKFVHKVLEWLTAEPVADRTEELARMLAARLWEGMAGNLGDPLPAGTPAGDEDDVAELRRDRLQIGLDVFDTGKGSAVWSFKGQAWTAIRYAVSIEHEWGGEVAYREVDVSGTKVAGVPFRGYVDRVDRHASGLIVVDYKSGKPPLDRSGTAVDSAKLAEKAEQLIWYWPAVEQVTGEQVVGALLAYIGGGYETVLWVDDDGRAAAEDRLAGLWTALQAWERLAVDRGEPYPTDPSPLCGWCPFFADCSAGSRFLHEKWAWMCTRDREGRPVPAKVEIDSWGKERRARWDEFVRHG